MEEEIFVHENPHGKKRLSTKGRIHPNGVKYIRADIVEEQLKQVTLGLPSVIKSYTTEDVDKAYDKGFNDGASAAATDICNSL